MTPALPATTTLPVAYLAASFNKTTNSYKFYWFLAILEMVKRKQGAVLAIDDLLAQMVATAWYPIQCFRLSLGKQDGLNQITHELQAQYPQLNATTKTKEIVKAVAKVLAQKSPLAQQIRNLAKYVPQRFLRPFFQDKLRKVPDWQTDALIESFAQAGFSDPNAPCLYRFAAHPQPSIEIQPDWLGYLEKHLAILNDFCLWHLAKYLQRNNPNAPNIAGKLASPEQRDLKLAKVFWQLALGHLPHAQCIYSGVPLTKANFSLDHFLPWSFVAHDLLWNIIPTPKAINSAKNDQLPKFAIYFDAFAALQFQAVQQVAKLNRDKLLEDYILLFKLDSVPALQALAAPAFCQTLADTLTPQIQIARNMGFAADWVYHAPP